MLQNRLDLRLPGQQRTFTNASRNSMDLNELRGVYLTTRGGHWRVCVCVCVCGNQEAWPTFTPPILAEPHIVNVTHTCPLCGRHNMQHKKKPYMFKMPSDAASRIAAVAQHCEAAASAAAPSQSAPACADVCKGVLL
eukprot:GHRQ01012852.1.p3 GENE.GHRQ01012852.1~~GHRQ01012852.1.p3  ORF type:complete len:137 (+),score=22.47 GHRQ01012852.1:531-941(+)